MTEVLEIGDQLITTGEYAETLQLLLDEAVKQTEYLHGIYGLGWVLCGVIIGCLSSYFIYRMIIT